MSGIGYQRPPIRIALLGLGRAMLTEHVPVFRQHPSLFKVVAACDLRRDRRDLLAKDFPQCQMFRRVADMLDERDIDLVDVATPSVDHQKHALLSLKKGFWTLLETPLALSQDDAQVLRGQAVKANNRLMVVHRGLFDPDFLLARQMLGDPRLGRLYQVVVRKRDYIRRDDWQCVKALGGGAANYVMPDLMLMASRLLGTPPVQMWSDMKRVASYGDAEDYAHVVLKTREMLTADIKYSGGSFAPADEASFILRGDRGEFRVSPGASEGTLVAIDAKFRPKRLRASVRTPDLDDMHEQLPLVRTRVSLAAGTPTGASAFWRHVYDSVRTAAPFPLALDESIETVKFSYLMKKGTPFGK